MTDHHDDTAAAVYANDVQAHASADGLRARGAVAAKTAEIKPVANAEPVDSGASDVDGEDKQVAVTKEDSNIVADPEELQEEDDGKLKGWKRNLALVGVFTAIFVWAVSTVTISQIFMNLFSCSQAQHAHYQSHGIEDPMRWMMTCDFLGQPDMTPYSLPDNPPPFTLPDPLCLPKCERAPFWPQWLENAYVPITAVQSKWHDAQHVAYIAYRIVRRLVLLGWYRHIYPVVKPYLGV
ncbi:hypothetical protein AMAG_15782 [Allomyces macrogynus ATCC 38327]|uniref:Uncharacterized protein n=1 Tax=Allomyces macrogynus (strain ATCC 38327) TaxID=578462 RepID=A0A0L0T990_ALLM3|nr:hypothetical protein AMAG_15782 [Allomyces macrogynus ATCC 38327]|eukprot:KNE71109.1 hypothetical protein AMAG_15782 [Allomyces macrogynus ATCC 38327]